MRRDGRTRGFLIAATTVALDVPMVTQDDVDVEVGGLRVIRV